MAFLTPDRATQDAIAALKASGFVVPPLPWARASLAVESRDATELAPPIPPQVLTVVRPGDYPVDLHKVAGVLERLAPVQVRVTEDGGAVYVYRPKRTEN